MFKGVYRGQPEALDEEPHPLTSTAGMPPETMTYLMKGGFRLSPAPGAQSMQRGDEYNVSTPPITTSRSYLNCGQNEAGGQDYFSSATTRDVPQAPPVFPDSILKASQLLVMVRDNFCAPTRKAGVLSATLDTT